MPSNADKHWYVMVCMRTYACMYVYKHTHIYIYGYMRKHTSAMETTKTSTKEQLSA